MVVIRRRKFVEGREYCEFLVRSCTGGFKSGKRAEGGNIPCSFLGRVDVLNVWEQKLGYCPIRAELD